MKLRGDDPSAMKDFVLCIQNRVNVLKSYSEGTQDGNPNINSKRVISLCPYFLFQNAASLELVHIWLNLCADGIHARDNL